MATQTSNTSLTTDHEQIRQWAESRGAQPACVRGTGDPGDIGMLRLDFPGFTGKETLQPISWDEFFAKFDERQLALLYQDTTSGGRRSNFNKLISRDAEERERSAPRRRAAATPRRKAAARRPAAQRTTARRSTAKRTTTSKKKSASTARNSTAKKATTSRTRPAARTAKRAAAKRTTGRKTTARKTTLRSSTASKSTRSTANRARSLMTRDHEAIRRWAEARQGKPACVRGTGSRGDIGVLRIDFPRWGGRQPLQKISWDQFFKKFDERRLKMVYQEKTANGKRSNFNKLVSRTAAR